MLILVIKVRICEKQCCERRLQIKITQRDKAPS